ncbi:hypothetical protein PHYPSEUDO_013421 [Phytophthora pseudosyringae]|uniref:SURP motif domain-containing protein n=1 Tax=Phytophthora pseudosyringae TaxID=221518 RepID=A0A8T1WLS7_9STRA|nr:hypothetical protein PHYPSEUDO_013421 [Phytophthora pseudosyringae]
MGYGGLGRGSPPASSAQLEQQFQARIAQAKEAARLASISAAARAQSASNAPPFAQGPAVPGVPFRPPPRFSPAPEHAAMGSIPPDVRNRIDRLVEFVARNGDAFEATAKQRERDNPDFAFLEPGGPYSDYYQWKKQQMCGAQQQPSVAGLARSPPPRPPLGSADPLGGMSVGAMANVCKFARASGVQAYAPIPGEVIRGVASLPAVEPARLEIRLSEFYRHEEEKKNRREAVL